MESTEHSEAKMSTATKTQFDSTDPAQARAHLDHYLTGEPVEGNSTRHELGLIGYKAHVRRWMHCAPSGAVFLVAPLSGWRGEPFTARAPIGVYLLPGRNMREARIKRGLNPFNGERFGAEGIVSADEWEQIEARRIKGDPY